MRSLTELHAAVAYLTTMIECAQRDPDGALNAKVANKGRSILQWAIGVDNQFGELVSAWNAAGLTASTDPRPVQPAKHRSRRKHNPWPS